MSTTIMLTLQIPEEYRDAVDALDSRSICNTKLFIDAMLGYLALCDDYTPSANTLVDLAIRLKRVEDWVSEQISKEEEGPEEEPEVTGTIHIRDVYGWSYCGVTKKKAFPVKEADLLLALPGTSLCTACRRIHDQALGEENKEKADG